VELNLALVESMGRVRLLDGAEEGRVLPLSDVARGAPVTRLQVQDDHQDVDLRLDLLFPAAVWHYPVRTVSRSEKGYEANYQGSALLIVWGGSAPVPRETSIVLMTGPLTTQNAV
jgi:hypothetical protein